MDRFILSQIANFLAENFGIFHFDAIEDEEPDAYSYLGTRIFGLFIFEPTEYEFLGQKFETPELRLPIAILDVTKQNTIVETALKGRTGTIKEYISTSDYIISLSGFLGGTSKKYPHEEAKKLDEISNSKSSIKITNSFLNTLGIFKVVVKDYTTSQIKGVKNLLGVKINMVSDLTEL